MSNPPYRADQVGSLLRDPELKAAHEKFLQGQYDPASLRALQDRCIRDAIRLQEAIGFHAITDGEFRRSSFSGDFIEKLDGAKTPGHLAVPNTAGGDKERTAAPGKRFAPRAFTVSSKLRHSQPIEVESFKFVKANTTRTAKQAMPSPTMLLRGGRSAVSTTAYPDLAEFHEDIARVYIEELRQLGAAGCTYVQLDDTNYAYLCDAQLREVFRQWGDDPNDMPDRFAHLINKIIAGKPTGMTVGIHLCRGNSSGQWAAEGAYEPIADKLLNQLDVDGYFLEYDDERSGGFEPLRFFPKRTRKRIVLGLVSTKSTTLETKDALKRRIDQAAQFVPLENLCLSPQCGFASTYRGNPLTHEIQRRKLELVVETAIDVWGTAK